MSHALSIAIAVVVIFGPPSVVAGIAAWLAGRAFKRAVPKPDAKPKAPK